MKAKVTNYARVSTEYVKRTYKFLNQQELIFFRFFKYEKDGHTIIETENFFSGYIKEVKKEPYRSYFYSEYDELGLGFRIDETDKTITFIIKQYHNGNLTYRHLTLKTDEIDHLTVLDYMPLFIHLKDGRVICIIKTEKDRGYDTPADFYLLQPLSSVD